MKIVTFGVFDLFHYGHLNLFKNIKKACGSEHELIVAVQDSDFIKKFKPNTTIRYSTEIRVDMIESLRCVDKVVVYTEVQKDIKNIDFDILIKGPDQSHSGFMEAVEWCKANGKQVLTIDRTEGVSSTELKQLKS